MTDNWFFRKVAIPCPRCSGSVFRDLRFVHRLLFLLPFHLLMRPRYRCFHCEVSFTGRINAVDVLLPALFASVHLLLADKWWIPIVFLCAWIGLSLFLGEGQGPIHVFVAALIVATLWFFAFIVRGLVPPGPALTWVYVAVAYLGLGFAFLCLILDRLLTGELVEDERDGRQE